MPDCDSVLLHHASHATSEAKVGIAALTMIIAASSRESALFESVFIK